MEKTCEFCGSLIPDYASFCGHCGRVSSRSEATETMASDMHFPDIQNIDTSMLSGVPGNVPLNPAYDQQPSMSTIPTASLSQEEEEEKRRRALLLGMGVPLLGSLVVDGMPEAENVPMVQGSPQVGGVPTVQGTPDPQAGSMGQEWYSSPTTMAPQQPPVAPLSPLPTTTVTLPPPHHSHHPSNPPTPSPKPKGCSLALIIAAIIIPILILLSFIGVGLILFAPSIALSGSTTVVQGGNFTLEGNHFIPGSSVSLSLDTAIPIYFVSRRQPDQRLSTAYSSMQLLTLDAQTTRQIELSNNTITVAGDGTFSVTIAANPSWSIGKHTITATESPTHRSTSIDFTIYATGTTPTPTSTGDATPTPTSSQPASPTPTTTLTPTIAGLSCVNPSTLSLGPVMQGSNQPVTAQVSLCTSGNGTVNWTATWDQIAAPWLQLDHTSGQTIAPGQTQVTVSAVASNLAPGSHTVTVAFTSQPANTSQSLQVTFTVQGGCISGKPSTLSYDGVANVSDPNSQMVTISNCGPTGTWTALPQTNNGGNWLFASTTTGTLNSGESSNITISASNLKAQLVAGTYTGSVSFKIGSGTFIVHATLTVTAAPTLSAKPLTIFANRQCVLGPTGGNWLCSISLINNSASVGLPWTARSSSGNISISPSNGFIQAGQSSSVQFSIPQSDCSPKGAGTITFTGPANAVTVAWNCILGRQRSNFMENDPFIGQQLGPYAIQSKLGEGGMARVYKGYHARLRREVAIKVILSQVADKEGFQARFEREAQLIASLQHPNIVAVYDFGETGHITFLVMQYVGGGTLRDQLRGGHALEPRQAILYSHEMAKALHHAHRRGIVHRDVKPQNMLVSETDRNQLLLSDFGIAKLFDTSLEATHTNVTGGSFGNDPSLTSIDQIVGTAEYMSPEQINGKTVDARTDVYALGVVLYQMLAGEVPFHSTTIQGLLFQHVYTPPRFICEVNPAVPEILGQITAKAMAKAPEDRFQSAETMAQALESANQFITRQLSASLPGNFVAPTPNTTSQPQNPAITSNPSYYAVQPPPASQNAVAGQQMPTRYGMTPPHGSLPITNPGGVSSLKPGTKRTAGKLSITYVVFALVLLLSIGLLLAKAGVLPGFSSNQNHATTTATSFHENFQNNTRNWTVGTNGGLATEVGSNRYNIQINDGQATTYFPHPDVGTLPANFVLTVTMEQTQGTPNALFGLAFRENDDGNGGNVTCYAFGIQTNGTSRVLKYDPSATNTNHSIILGGSSNPVPGFIAGNNQLHSIQAIVHGNTFFFKVDNQLVPVSASQDKSISDSQYSGGNLTLYVSGSNAAFVVTSVQLAVQ